MWLISRVKEVVKRKAHFLLKITKWKGAQTPAKQKQADKKESEKKNLNEFKTTFI